MNYRVVCDYCGEKFFFVDSPFCAKICPKCGSGEKYLHFTEEENRGILNQYEKFDPIPQSDPDCDNEYKTRFDWED